MQVSRGAVRTLFLLKAHFLTRANFFSIDTSPKSSVDMLKRLIEPGVDRGRSWNLVRLS